MGLINQLEGKEAMRRLKIVFVVNDQNSGIELIKFEVAIRCPNC